MAYLNKQVFTTILLGILFSILFASAVDSQSGEEKSIASIPFIQPASAQQSSPPAGYIEQESYSGDCKLRPSGTVCMGYSDGYIWLLSDIKLGFEKIQEDGMNVEVVVGNIARYYHILNTNFVKTGSLITQAAPEPAPNYVSTDFVTIPWGTDVPGCERTNGCYSPYAVSVEAGTTVTWKNDDTTGHTVTSGVSINSGGSGPDGFFDSNLLMAGTSFDVTFDTAGTYPYFCLIHPWATGYVIVEPALSSKIVSGELKVEKENYEVSYSGTTLVKLFGTVDSSTRGDKITFTITNPEGDKEEFSVIPSKEGYFESYLPFDKYSLLGIYEASAFTSQGSLFGKISFQLYDKNNPIVSTAKEPEPATEPATEPAPPPSISEEPYSIGTDFLFMFEKQASGIAVNSKNIFTVDRYGIQIFDLSGNFVDKFGSRGSGDGEFKSPEGIAVNSKHIFVADTENYRIQIFDLSGNFVDKFGSLCIARFDQILDVDILQSGCVDPDGGGPLELGDGQFRLPRGIAADDTHIVVADTNNQRIQIFNSAGVFQSKFGSPDSYKGMLSSQGIALDSSGNIYVADSSDDRIQIFNSEGVFQSKFGSTGEGELSFPVGVAVDSSGNIYVVSPFDDYIQIFNSAGVFQSKLGSSGSGDGQFESIRDIAIDSTRIYVADINGVQVFGSSLVEGSVAGPVPTEITSYLPSCEGLLSVDEVKTVMGYTDELAVEFSFDKLPQPPKIKGACMFSFVLSGAIRSEPAQDCNLVSIDGELKKMCSGDPTDLIPPTYVLNVMVSVTDAAPSDEEFNEALNKIKASSSEVSQGESETGWKLISAIINEGMLESQIVSFKDRYSLVIFTPSNLDNVPLADLSQLHEIAKIGWENIDKNIITVSDATKEKIPGWIKNNAKWWSEGQIGDSDFTNGIQHLMKEKIINIPDLPEQASGVAEEKVPDWVKNNAGWWADGLISEDDFLNGIKYLVEKGIIKI